MPYSTRLRTVIALLGFLLLGMTRAVGQSPSPPTPATQPASMSERASTEQPASTNQAAPVGPAPKLRRNQAKANLRIERDVVYASVDGTRLLGDIVAPLGNEKKPGVIVIHGGAWVSGDKDQMDWIAQHLAENGFFTLNINYRLAPTHKFPAQMEDCQRAVAWMRSRSKDLSLDPDWQASYGYSAGAHLALLLGMRPLDLPDAEEKTPFAPVRAVVAGGAPCDFRALPENFQGMAYFLGGSRAKAGETYRLASPAAFVSNDDPPIFFYHGQSDLLAPEFVSRRTYESLKKLGVRTEFFEIAKTGHVGAFLSWDAVHKATSFLKASYAEQVKQRSTQAAW